LELNSESTQTPRQISKGMKMNQVDDLGSKQTPKIFVICDRSDTAPVWGYILRQRGLTVTLETIPKKALDHWLTDIHDLVVIDIDIKHQEHIELYKQLRGVSMVPILLFLPAHDETQILEAYEAGVDEVVIKPVSPPIFLAKILSWARRSWIMPISELEFVKAGSHRLDPTCRCISDSQGQEIKLTNLEFRLLHLLMSRPGHVFKAEDIIESIWGGYGNGDQVLLKNVVYRLRRKIEADPSHPSHLQTWDGGYSFNG